MNLEKYVKNRGSELDIQDMKGEVSSLPEDFFDNYSEVKWLSIYGTELTDLPASINRLKQLTGIKLYRTKIKSLPDSISSLEELTGLSLYTNSFDLNKEVRKLQALPHFEFLDLNGYRGSVFPPNISELKNLKRIKIGSDLKKKLRLQEVVDVAIQLPFLEELEINIPVVSSDIDESFLKLDRPIKIHGYSWPFRANAETLPLLLGRTKHMLLDERLDGILSDFRQKVRSDQMSADQLQTLFGIHIKNYTALNEFLPNALKISLDEKKVTNLVLLDKPKGESAKSIKEKLAAYNVTIGAEGVAGNILVVGGKTVLEDAEGYIRNNDKVITVDHLKDVLVALEDPWLMQKDNESSNDQLLQLLASNQTENYQIAFQIIEGGGANKTIQSLLAAIMLSHPEASVHKAAEKLYDRYGSQSFKAHAKGLKASLRKSGHTEGKVEMLVNHPDVDAFAFRLMHHCIAGSNKNIADVHPGVLHIKGVKNVEISVALPFFTHISEIHFEGCENLELEKGIQYLKQATWCKILHITNCRIQVPASIAELTHLTSLDLGFNTVPHTEALQHLKSLRNLSVEGTKISSWNWLTELPVLESLNISHCALPHLPQELYSIRTLKSLEAKQNKIAVIDERISSLRDLTTLDFSNNQLSSFPYFLAKLPNLATLLLRSNSIGEFDPSKARLESKATSFNWVEFNLARNDLKSFSFGGISVPGMRVLDISHNEISTLDDSIFRSSSLRELYANNNDISFIPPSISKVGHFTKLWLHKNRISRLEDYMARIRVENCDLSDNQIDFIHPDFDVIGKDNYGRLYWKIRNNPISKSLNKFGGLYG